MKNAFLRHGKASQTLQHFFDKDSEGAERLGRLVCLSDRANTRDSRLDTTTRGTGELDRHEHVATPPLRIDERQWSTIQGEIQPLFIRHGKHKRSLHRANVWTNQFAEYLLLLRSLKTAEAGV